MSLLTKSNEVNVVGGDGDDRDRPSTRPDGPGSDWRPPYSGILRKQIFIKRFSCACARYELISLLSLQKTPTEAILVSNCYKLTMNFIRTILLDVHFVQCNFTLLTRFDD